MSTTPETEIRGLLEKARLLIADCKTYNFGMRNADRLAHEVAERLVDTIEQLIAEAPALPGDLTDETTNQPWNDPADPNSPVYDTPWEKAAAIIATIRGAQFDTLYDRPTDEAQDEITMSIQRLDELCATMLAAARVAPVTPSEGGVPIIEYAQSFTTPDAVAEMAVLLMTAWGKGDPGSVVSQHPVSYVATFADMARAVLVAQPVAPVAPSERPADRPCPHMPKGETRRAGECDRCAVESGWVIADRPAPSPDRENLSIRYCPEHGDLLTPGVDGSDERSARCRESHSLATLAALAVPPVVNNDHPDGASDEREYSELGALERWLRWPGREHHFYADRIAIAVGELRSLRRIAAAAPVVNEAKLAEVLDSPTHAPASTHSAHDGSCSECPWPVHQLPPAEMAHVLAERGHEWLG